MLALLLVLTAFSSSLSMIKTSGQFALSDFYVYIRVNMDENAIAIYNVNITMGAKSIRDMDEANWTLKIQIQKWATPNLVYSAEMPNMFLESGEKIPLVLEEGEDYDYLIAKLSPVQDGLNATIKIGFVQRGNISSEELIGGCRVGVKLPILTGFNIVPEYINFTFLTTGMVTGYSLQQFTPIFFNDTIVGLWGQYFRTKDVEIMSALVIFSKSFEKVVIEDLIREITITEQLQASVRDRLKVKYMGSTGTGEILKIILPINVSQRVKVRDTLGPLWSYTSSSGTNTSTVNTIVVYARYFLRPGQEYEAIVEYSIPLKNMLTEIHMGMVTFQLKDLANYTEIVSMYSLNVKVMGGLDCMVEVESATTKIKSSETFSRNFTNAMTDIVVQPLKISFIPIQLEAGKSLSLILGLLTLSILMVVDLFKEQIVKPDQESKEKQEVEMLIEKLMEVLSEKVNCESLLEEVKVKNALGKISSKEYRKTVEEYERRISGSEKRITKTIEQISFKNPKTSVKIKRSYEVFEEINADLRKLIDNVIERFKGGRITRNIFENLSKKYLKDNRKRREAAAEEVRRPLEELRF